MVDVVIAVCAALVVAGVIVLAVVKKKQGKIIGCDCSSCDKACCKRKDKS